MIFKVSNNNTIANKKKMNQIMINDRYNNNNQTKTHSWKMVSLLIQVIKVPL